MNWEHTNAVLEDIKQEIYWIYETHGNQANTLPEPKARLQELRAEAIRIHNIRIAINQRLGPYFNE